MKKFGAILVVVLLCCGFVPQHKASRQHAPTKSSSELYTEAIKAVNIHKDTLGAIKAIEALMQQDSNYAPALNLLARITPDTVKAVIYAERAYLSDTTNLHYLNVYAQTLLSVGNANKAIRVFKKLVRTSNDPHDFRMLAALYGLTRQNNEALAVLDSADVRFGRIPPLGLLRQRILLSSGRLEDAVADAKMAIEKEPYLAMNHITLANIYATARKDSLALVSLQTAIKVDSLAIEPWLALAEFYQNRREHAAYLSILPRIFASKELTLEDKISEWNQLCENTDLYRKHLSLYDTIIKQLCFNYPESKAVTKLYILHLLRMGENQAAERLSKNLLELPQPTLDDFKAVFAIENYLARPDSVGHYLDIALKHFPQNGELIMMRAQFNIDRKRYDKAIGDLNHALELSQDDNARGEICATIGYTEYKRKNIDGYYKAFDKAIKYSRGNDTLRSQHYAFMGDIEFQRKETKRSFAAYKKALRYFADNALALNNYAYYLSLEECDLERALMMINRALELSDKNATYLDTKAWVLYKLGQYNEAKKVMRQALALNNGDDPTFLLHYGDILYALGEEFIAKTYWRKALEQGADKAEIEKRFLPNEQNPKK